MKKVYPWYSKYVFAAFRRIFRWSPERKKVLKDAQEKTKFRCATCKQLFIRKKIAVDHKEPVVDPSKGFEGWDTYASRLFVDYTALQVLCKDCHKSKTNAENKDRRKAA